MNTKAEIAPRHETTPEARASQYVGHVETEVDKLDWIGMSNSEGTVLKFL